MCFWGCFASAEECYVLFLPPPQTHVRDNVASRFFLLLTFVQITICGKISGKLPQAMRESCFALPSIKMNSTRDLFTSLKK